MSPPRPCWVLNQRYSWILLQETLISTLGRIYKDIQGCIVIDKASFFRAITTSELTKDFNKDLNGYVRVLLQETLTRTSDKGPTRISKAISDHIKNSSNELINRSVFKCLWLKTLKRIQARIHTEILLLNGVNKDIQKVLMSGSRWMGQQDTHTRIYTVIERL